MNKLLANIIGVLNGFLALLFIIGGALIGADTHSDGGLVIGLVIGLILAITVCGVLAIFISMRDELTVIRGILDRWEQTP